MLYLSLSKRVALFILAASVCWPLQHLFSTLAEEGDAVSFLGSPVQSCCGEGGTCRQLPLVCVGSARRVSASLGLPHSWRVCFHGLYFSGSRLLCWDLSEVGTGLHALPRSKLLRFRFWGSPQRRRPAFCARPGSEQLS